MEPPADVPRAAGANALPFRDMFTEMEKVASEKSSPNVFIPESYWRDERKVPAEKLKPAYQREKVRFQFNTWKNADIDKREKYSLTIVYRPGSTKEHPAPGLDVWMTVAV